MPKRPPLTLESIRGGVEFELIPLPGVTWTTVMPEGWTIDLAVEYARKHGPWTPDIPPPAR